MNEWNIHLYLEGEEKQESHHETEQSHSLGQSEPQDGIGEQLLLESGVPERDTGYIVERSDKSGS